MTDLLRIDGLGMTIGAARILDGVSVSIAEGECVALVGESGSGKSMTAKTVLGMQPPRAQLAGSVAVMGTEIIGQSPKVIRRIRQEQVSMIYQNPRPGMNPVRRVGSYIIEGVTDAGLMSRSDAHARAIELMKAVRLRNPEELFSRYPHQLSGGMLQRIMIVGALMSNPQLMLCDEPTTALDVTTQAEVIAILRDLQVSRGLGMLFITHDLDLAAAISSRTYVTYQGEVVESGDSHDILHRPQHPYTAALLGARPTLEGPPRTRLVSVAERMTAGFLQQTEEVA